MSKKAKHPRRGKSGWQHRTGGKLTILEAISETMSEAVSETAQLAIDRGEATPEAVENFRNAGEVYRRIFTQSSPETRNLFLKMYSYMITNGTIPEMEVLQNICRLSMETVQSCMECLEEIGFINILEKTIMFPIAKISLLMNTVYMALHALSMDGMHAKVSLSGLKSIIQYDTLISEEEILKIMLRLEEMGLLNITEITMEPWDDPKIYLCNFILTSDLARVMTYEIWTESWMSSQL